VLLNILFLLVATVSRLNFAVVFVQAAQRLLNTLRWIVDSREWASTTQLGANLGEMNAAIVSLAGELGRLHAEFQQHTQQQQQQSGVFSHQELEASILAGATASAVGVPQVRESTSTLMFGDLPGDLELDEQQQEQLQPWQGHLQQELQQQQQPDQHLYNPEQGYQLEGARITSSYQPLQAAADDTAMYGMSGLEREGRFIDQQQAESLPAYAAAAPPAAAAAPPPVHYGDDTPYGTQNHPEISNSSGWGEPSAANSSQKPTDLSSEYGTSAASGGGASGPSRTAEPAPRWGGAGVSFAAMAAAPPAAKHEEQARKQAAASQLQQQRQQQQQKQQQRPPLPLYRPPSAGLPSPGKLTSPARATALSPGLGASLDDKIGAATAAVPNPQLMEPLVPDSAALMSWITQRAAGEAGQQEVEEADATDDLKITDDDFTVVQSKKKKQRGAAAAAGRDKERRGGAGAAARGGHGAGDARQQHGRQQQAVVRQPGGSTTSETGSHQNYPGGTPGKGPGRGKGSRYGH
jgi:hypothetical protein